MKRPDVFRVWAEYEFHRQMRLTKAWLSFMKNYDVDRPMPKNGVLKVRVAKP